MLNTIYVVGGAIIIVYSSYIVVKEVVKTKEDIKGFIRKRKENK